jgi:hypothetical protein
MANETALAGSPSWGSLPRVLSQFVDQDALQASDVEWEKVRRFTSGKLISPTPKIIVINHKSNWRTC